MLNPDPIVRAGVFAAPECMIPGKVQLKRSVQLVLQELTKNWSDDENVDLLFSITALADRMGANRAAIHSGLRTLSPRTRSASVAEKRTPVPSTTWTGARSSTI